MTDGRLAACHNSGMGTLPTASHSIWSAVAGEARVHHIVACTTDGTRCRPPGQTLTSSTRTSTSCGASRGCWAGSTHVGHAALRIGGGTA